jgi:hypothetical protein
MKKLFNLSLILLLMTMVALQSGCVKDGDNNEYPDVTASADTINGIVKYRQIDTSGTNVVDWKFGLATIKAIENGSGEIATAKVNADGSFMLILPATLLGTYFVSLADVAAQQGGTITATPETVRLAGSTQFEVEYTDNGTAKSMLISLCTLKADKSVDKSYFYNFYDSDGTFIGKGSGTAGNNFNWTFTKGWGLVENYTIGSTSNAMDSKSVNAALPNAIWVN